LHGLAVVGTAINATEAIALSRELSPDIVLMDIEMLGGD
jgi:YesN/AraC family two-component response regulator